MRKRGWKMTNARIVIDNNNKIVAQNGYIVASENYVPDIVENGLVLHLDASNPLSYSGSGNIWTDLSGHNHNATLHNGVGFSTNALVLDGNDDYADIPAHEDFVFGTDDFAIEVWFYSSISPDINQGAYIYAQAATANNYLVMVLLGDKVYATQGHATVQKYSASAYLLNTWNFCVWTRKNGISNLYLNNTVSSSSSTIMNLNNSIYLPTIGRPYQDGGTSTPFNGMISLLRVYKGQGLSAEEVTQNFEATRGRFGV